MRPLDIVFMGLMLAVLIPIVATDLRERRIPNRLNLALGGLGLLHTVLRAPHILEVALSLGGAAITLVLLLGTRAVLGLIDRRAVFGLGDVKFLVAASLWVGVQGSVAVMLVASLVSILAALAAAPWRGLRMREALPFAPMLAIGLLAVSLAGYAAAAPIR
ncbi:MAG: prepilin peptidase [Rhodospirillales bacterium]|nr:prepilin peptidase [Rhodospirillales bacterium]